MKSLKNNLQPLQKKKNINLDLEIQSKAHINFQNEQKNQYQYQKQQHRQLNLKLKESFKHTNIQNQLQKNQIVLSLNKTTNFDNKQPIINEDNFHNIPEFINKDKLEKQQQNKKSDVHISSSIYEFCSKIAKSQFYSYFYISLLFCYLILNSLEAIQKNSKLQQICEYIDLAFQIIFSLTIIIKFILIYDQDLLWLGLDIISNIFGYFSYGIVDEEALRYLKCIKVTRNFLLIKYSIYLNVPATQMINSLRSVSKILIPAAMFVYFYAVVGLFSFRDYQYNKCRDPSNKYLSQNWTVYANQIFLCGQKSCPKINGIQLQCLNPIDRGVQPNQLQVYNIMQGHGLMRYNNIWFALFSTIKQFFVTGSSRLMILGKQVLNQYYTLIYYLSYTYLLAYIYSNVFYGLMTSNTQQKAEQQKQALTLKLSAIENQTNQNTYQEESIRMNKKHRKSMQLSSSQLENFRNVHHTESGFYQQLNHFKNTQIIKSKRQKNKLKNLQEQKIREMNNVSIVLNEQKNDEMQNERNIQQEKQQNKQLQNNQFIQNNQNVQKQIQWSVNKQHQLQKNPQEIIFGEDTKKVNENQLKQGDDEISQQSQTYEQKQNLRTYQNIMRKYYIFQHIVIILCTINICIDYQNQQMEVRLITDIIDFCFFSIFLLQMAFRLMLHRIYKPKQTLDKDYKIDLAIFILCLAGMVYEVVVSNTILQFVLASDQTSLILRTLKYLRILVILTSTPYLVQSRVIFTSTFASIFETKFMILLWLLIALIFSIMGYHLFQGQTLVDNNGNFDLYSKVNQQNGKPFPLSFQGLENSIIFTLFAFYNQEWDWFVFQQYIGSGWLIVIWQLVSLFVGLQLCSKYFMSILMNQLGNRLNQYTGLNSISHTVVTSVHQQKRFESFSFVKSNQIIPIQQIFHQRQNQINEPRQLKRKSSRKKTLELKNNIKFQPQISILQRINRLPILIFKSNAYLWIRLTIIVISIVLVFLMNPLKDPNSYQMIVYARIWWATLVFFGLQIIVSIFTFGLFTSPYGYLTKLINWIYLIVFIMQILNLIPGVKDIYFIHTILCLRILRIFVFIEIKYYLDRNMRIAIISFWKLIPKVVVLLIGTFILDGFFAIILVKMYKQDSYYCDGHSSPYFVDTMQDCLNWGGNWIQTKMNMSNYVQSLVYLYLLATCQGWSAQVVQNASLRGVGYNAVPDSNVFMYYYISVFFFWGNLIMLNIFLGLSINNFKQIQLQITGEDKLTQDDKVWLSIKNQIYRLKPKIKIQIPANIIKKSLFTFLKSRQYKILNAFLFIGFMINMSFFGTNMSKQKQTILYAFIHVFVGIFLFFYLISFIAFGQKMIKRRFFKIQTLAVIYIIIHYIVIHTINLDPRERRVIQSVVICLLAIRYFTLLTQIDYIKKLINLLLTVLPQTSNIWLLVVVILLIYAAIGIEIFGYLRISPQINQFDQNYTSLDKALYALIKFSILQSPVFQVIDGATLFQPNAVCFQINNYEQYAKYGRMGCGNKFKSYIFFISFHVIYIQIVVSTLMAIIFNAYNEVRRQEQSMVNKFQLQQVQTQWRQFDPQATGFISYFKFWQFTGKLLQIYHVNTKDFMIHQTKNSFLKIMHIPIYENQQGILSFQFHEVVQALTRMVLKQKKGNDWKTTQADKHFSYRNKSNKISSMNKSFYNSSDVQSLIKLKFGLKNWKKKTEKPNNKGTNKYINFDTVKNIMNKIRQSQQPSNQQINSLKSLNNLKQNFKRNDQKNLTVPVKQQHSLQENTEKNKIISYKLQQPIVSLKIFYQSNQAEQNSIIKKENLIQYKQNNQDQQKNGKFEKQQQVEKYQQSNKINHNQLVKQQKIQTLQINQQWIDNNEKKI